MYSVLKLFGFGTLFCLEGRNYIEKQLFQIYKASSLVFHIRAAVYDNRGCG